MTALTRVQKQACRDSLPDFLERVAALLAEVAANPKVDKP